MQVKSEEEGRKTEKQKWYERGEILRKNQKKNGSDKNKK